MDAEEARRLLLRRRSVLDAVHADFDRLKQRVSRADAEKLERHASSLRDVESRLGRIAEQPAGCSADRPSGIDDIHFAAEFGEVMRAQIDLLVHALACDVTRVGSLQCSTAVNACRFMFMDGMDREGHNLSHTGNGDETSQARWEQMLTWYAEQFAYLLDRLKDVPEGDGTLLDNTLVLWGMEISRGNTHSLEDMPFILAGNAGGGLRTGRYLKYQGASHNDLLVSMLNALDIDDVTFGDPRYCSGPLPGLV